MEMVEKVGTDGMLGYEGRKKLIFGQLRCEMYKRGKKKISSRIFTWPTGSSSCHEARWERLWRIGLGREIWNTALGMLSLKCPINIKSEMISHWTHEYEFWEKI